MKKVFFSAVSRIYNSCNSICPRRIRTSYIQRCTIDGTLNEYVTKMKQAGFTHIGTQDGTAILKGDFAGFKGCTIGVATLKTTNKVNTIGVIFPEQDDWDSLENNYTHLKSMLTEKYGEPSDCVETFQGYGFSTNRQ